MIVRGRGPADAWPSARAARSQPPVARPMPPPATAGTDARAAAAADRRRRSTSRSPVPPMPADDAIGSKSLDDLNRDSPLRPVFFELDSSDVSAEGQQVLQANARGAEEIPDAGRSPIEGHCDERGTAEYNLALGERRALAAQDLPGVARHRRRQGADRQLRQGVPVRCRSRRRRVVEEPPRAFRDHRKVRWAYEPTNIDAGLRCDAWDLRRCLVLLLACQPGRGAVAPRNADDGRHPHAAGADAAAAAATAAAIEQLTDDAQDHQRARRRAGRARRAKSFADQKLAVDQFGNDLRVVRERIDENNVRITSLSQEVEALRLAIPQFHRRAGRAGRSAARAGRRRARRPDAAAAGSGRRRRSRCAPGMSPQRLYNTALGRLHRRPVGALHRRLRHLPAELRAHRSRPTTRSGISASAISRTASSPRRSTPTTASSPTIRRAIACRTRTTSAASRSSAMGQTDRARESFETLMKNFPDTTWRGWPSSSSTRLTAGKPRRTQHTA